MEGTVEAMEAMEAMEATEDTTTARGPLMLMLSPPPLPSLDTTATPTDTEPTDPVMLLLTPTDIIIMARGLLMPSQDMVGTTAIMGTEVTTEDIMATVATEDTTTARS